MGNYIATRSSREPAWRCWLGLALLAVSGAAFAADDLHVYSDGLLTSAHDGTPSNLQVRIGNRGNDVLRDVRWVSSAGSLRCAGSTDAGRGFVEGGSLSAGDSISCSLPAESLGRSVSAAVAVSARDAQANVQVRHASLSLRTPRAPLTQAAVVVLGGAVHADANSNGLYEAGESIAYHYTVYNAGTLPLSALALSDIGGVVTCPQTTLATAAFMTCTRSYVVSAADQAAGLVVNVINATATASNGPVQGSDVIASLNLGGTAHVRVFKSPLLQDDVNGDGRASVGDLVRYTFLTKNSGAQTLTGLVLSEPDPTRIDTPITCSASTFAGQPPGAIGNATLLSNDVIACSADYTLRSTDQVLGQASNLVVVDANAAIGGPVNGSGASTVVIPADPRIAVTKTVNSTSTLPGNTVVYSITVSNVGVTSVSNVTVSDPLPAGINQFAWTCAGSAGATCPAPSGTGAINQLIPLLPAGGQLVYTVTATVAVNAPANVVNVVSVDPPGFTVCMPGMTPGPCTATVPLVVNTPYVEPLPVPAGNPWSWALLTLAITAFATRAKRRVATSTPRRPSHH